MIDLEFKFAGSILCLVGLISSLTSGAGVALQPRDADVDFSKMPDCSSKICVSILGSLLDCGGEITLGCFCRRPNPLVCAWSVNWDCWNRTEDWYDSQCPGKPLVDLTGIPECARNCFNKANVCIEQTSNCVCSQPKPDCSFSTTTCKAADVSLYDAWYTKSCKYNLTATTSPSTTGPSLNPTSSTSTSPTSTGSGGRKGLPKGAIAGVAIAAVAGALALGLLLYYCRGRGASSSDSAAVAPPDQYKIEDPSGLVARPGPVPSMVQSTPFFEAPGS
ncbi:hypothetical protein B9Z19DRAFT_1041022 [Tuber borchii]|uniref:Extracellular membrane protein CFEM domain-containing protein n=1 Tax=Tuber borchii TaxID=42251 RepID=A0A2T7A3Y1_TUBBO|nr:hypothetical protein B9Z19DRAFT_1041022 [Tuber borchii]